jgi:hypothetical protein
MNETPPRDDPMREPVFPVECERARLHLHSFVEGELDAIRSGRIRAHLGGCPACREIEEDLKLERLWLIESIVDTPSLSDSFTRKIIGKVEAALEAEKASRRRRAFTVWGFAGLAAALAVAALGMFILDGFRPHDDSHAVASTPPARLEPPLLSRPGVAVSTTLPSAGPRIGEVASQLLDSFAVSPARDTEPAVRFASYSRSPNFGHVYVMAAGLAPPSRARAALAKDDPCKPDPNRDGQVDWNDVAYSCQLIVSGQPPHPLESVDAAPIETDCDDSCFRA